MAKKKVNRKIKSKSEKYIGCTMRELPVSQLIEASRNAVAINPANAPSLLMATALVIEPLDVAVLTGKYWGAGGVNLSVSFLDTSSQALINKILEHMNAWSEFANVKFSWSQSGGDVRISRGASGYWSYLGTDIRMIGTGQPTMNLQGFTVNTPESEYKRVVRHETGHTLGFPHEQQRRAIVERLDVAKTIDYFRRTQGWSEQQTRNNVLTPLEERSIMGSPDTDETSIMCYALPASITRDNRPVSGGADFSSVDRSFVGTRLYPKAVTPPPDRLSVEIPRAGKWVWQEA